MKKTLVIILALTMIFAMSAVALAEDHTGTASTNIVNFNLDGESDNSAITTVSILSDTQISATIPLNVTLVVMANGTVQGPSNYTITNTSVFPIKVDSVAIAALDNFKLSGDEAKTDISGITLTNGRDVAPGTTIGTWIASKADNTNWNMSAAAGATPSITLAFGGSVTALTMDASAENGVTAFTITFTISAGNHVVEQP